MAASFTCDGCGTSIAKPRVVGHVIKRDYCEKCEPKAKDFLAEEEAIRIRIQATFQAQREHLIAICSANGFKLPDVA